MKVDKSRPLVIHHGNCSDGFASYWVVYKFYKGKVEGYPGVYQREPPDVTGRNVIMVDFSYKRPVIEKMLVKANSILIIDHHKSAEEEFRGFTHPKFNFFFDIEKSGATLTWEYYFEGEPPQLLQHIADRDLWKFELEGTREIQACLFSYPYYIPVWDKLITEGDLRDMATEGRAIERKHHKDIEELLAVTRRFMKIGGIEMPCANLPYTLSSDAGNLMAARHESGVAACYMDTREGRVFSLRSINSGPDVADIAKAYGGGGHARAAGFTVPIGWEGED